MSSENFTKTRTAKPKRTPKVPATPRQPRRAADPFFKRALTEIALTAGLKHGPTEFQLPRTTLSDMLLHVPPGTTLRNKVLAFLLLYNIIEFKGQHDLFDKLAFEIQLGRLHFWHAQNSKLTDLYGVLNLFVVARYPTEVFAYSAEWGCPFTMVSGQEWLWQARVGWQNVAIVVCEKMPVEEDYYQWLAFAPATSPVWNKYVRQLIDTQEWGILSFLFEMRGEEMYEMSIEVAEILAAYEPEEAARLQESWNRVILKWLPTATPKMQSEALKMMKGLTPEQRLEGLKPEERLAGLTTEERLALFNQLSASLDDQTKKDK